MCVFLQNVMAIRSCLIFVHSVHDLMAKASQVHFCTGQSFHLNLYGTCRFFGMYGTYMVYVVTYLFGLLVRCDLYVNLSPCVNLSNVYTSLVFCIN